IANDALGESSMPALGDFASEDVPFAQSDELIRRRSDHAQCLAHELQAHGLRRCAPGIGGTRTSQQRANEARWEGITDQRARQKSPQTIQVMNGHQYQLQGLRAARGGRVVEVVSGKDGALYLPRGECCKTLRVRVERLERPPYGI